MFGESHASKEDCVPTSLSNAEESEAGESCLTTNLFRSVIYDANLNTNYPLRLLRLNKVNELSRGFYLFFR